jgi:hypothetical protein
MREFLLMAAVAPFFFGIGFADDIVAIRSTVGGYHPVIRAPHGFMYAVHGGNDIAIR